MRLRERVISICLSVAMLLSVAPFQAKAAENTTPLIEVTVTETTETGATIHIKNNKDYGTNQIGFYKVLKKSEQGFDSAQALITSFGDITDSTTMMAASIPEFLAGPPTFTAQTEATKTVSDLEAGTEYVVYAAIGDYYANVAHMNHIGKSKPRHLNGKGFDLTGPHRYDAVVNRSQGKTANPVKQAAHCQHLHLATA